MLDYTSEGFDLFFLFLAWTSMATTRAWLSDTNFDCLRGKPSSSTASFLQQCCILTRDHACSRRDFRRSGGSMELMEKYASGDFDDAGEF